MKPVDAYKGFREGNEVGCHRLDLVILEGRRLATEPYAIALKYYGLDVRCRHGEHGSTATCGGKYSRQFIDCARFVVLQSWCIVGYVRCNVIVAVDLNVECEGPTRNDALFCRGRFDSPHRTFVVVGTGEFLHYWRRHHTRG